MKNMLLKVIPNYSVGSSQNESHVNLSCRLDFDVADLLVRLAAADLDPDLRLLAPDLRLLEPDL